MHYQIEAALGWYANKKGIKYIAIAQNTNLSLDVISRAFNGKRRLRAEESLLICDFMGIENPRDLCREYESRTA